MMGLEMRRLDVRKMTCLALCAGLLLGATAVGASEILPEREATMSWWRSAKFGMFIHWGIYAVTGGEYKGQTLPNSAEWMMNRGKIPVAEYERLAAQFNPVGFDADALVSLAKEAGMRYIVFTAKHHDGFSMFASRANRFNVVEATPFKRDMVRELAEACRQHGLRFGLYDSQAQDWYHPGGIGNTWDRTLKRVSRDVYVREKALPEVRQLLTEYGPISILWWDTPRQMSKEALDALYATRFLQPGLIINDRLGKDYPGDFQTFERKIPDNPPEGVDWEVCMPISDSWGYKKSDTHFKSSDQLIRNLVDIVSKGGNYLLNVSPTGDGTLLPQAVDRLRAIGNWMKGNSEAIYGTKASPWRPFPWGRCTRKDTAQGTIIYVHLFERPDDGRVLLPALKNTVREARLSDTGESVSARRVAAGVEVLLPAQLPDTVVTVIRLDLEGSLQVNMDAGSSVIDTKRRTEEAGGNVFRVVGQGRSPAIYLTSLPGNSGKFVHPGVAHTAATFAFVRERIAAHDQPWWDAWNVLRSSPEASLSWEPRPRAHVERGPSNHPDIGSSEFTADGLAAYVHALCWVLSGEEAHARKAAEILHAWASTLESISNHDARLLVGMSGYQYVVAAEIVKHTWNGWPAEQQKEFARMLREIWYPLIKDFYPTANGNWDASMLQTMIAMGVFLDDRAMFERAVEYFLHGEGNGAIGNYIWPSGQAQESGRDQAHTQMGLDFLAATCETAWIQGIDLYKALDNRLLKGFEYTARYNLGYDVPYEPFRSYRGRYYYQSISSIARGRLRPMYERVYNHYHNRRGLEAPYTWMAVQQLRARLGHRGDRSAVTNAIEILMYADQPAELVPGPTR
mgnify:CR=1 FL=1